MSALSDLTEAMEAKIVANITGINGIQWVEEVAPDGTNRPKIIIDVVKFRSARYVDQRTLEWNFYFRIIGYLKKIIPDGTVLNNWTKADRLAINDLAFETVNTVYALHDDKQAGTLNVRGFQMFAGECECWVDLELAPGQASFGANVVAIMHLADTDGGSNE